VRFLLSRRWLLFAIVVAALVWGAILLGQWQFHRLDERQQSLGRLAIATTGGWIASAGVAGSVWLWKPATGERHRLDGAVPTPPVLAGAKSEVVALTGTRRAPAVLKGGSDMTQVA